MSQSSTAQDISTEVAQELLDALKTIVHGATITRGQDSSGWDYAHVRQVMLDVGRAAIARAESSKS